MILFSFGLEERDGSAELFHQVSANRIVGGFTAKVESGRYAFAAGHGCSLSNPCTLNGKIGPYL